MSRIIIIISIIIIIISRSGIIIIISFFNAQMCVRTPRKRCTPARHTTWTA